jgi:geranylgeranyl reductase family protein
MEIKKFDVLIVGAGPAGCACALKLADSGLKVALLDKAVFPRDKTCGDALSIDVVNQLPLLSEQLATRFANFTAKIPSYGVSIYSPDHQLLEIPFVHKNKKGCGYISTRLDFDNFLFEQVQQLPNLSIFQNCTIQHITNTADGVKIQTNLGEFTGEIVVGADGAHSVVAKQLNANKVEKAHYSAGLRVYYEGVTNLHSDNFIELHFFKELLPGYLWIFPLPNNKANVGLGVLSSEVSARKLNLKEILQKLVQTHPALVKRFENAKPLETVKGFGLPLGSKKRKISGYRFLLTGDAAGLIDPFSGEGIGNAIRSGRVAAEHIGQCFAQKDFSAKFNERYDEEIYRRMWKELKLSRTLQKLCKYPGLFNFIVKRANKSLYLKQYFTEALANIEVKKRLINPLFYWHLFKAK